MIQLWEVPITPRSPGGFERIAGPERLRELERTAGNLKSRLNGRAIWNVNSTASGGGVAELLHSLLAYARGLDVNTRWIVIGGSPEYFRLTKTIHNAMHGHAGNGSELGESARAAYEQTSAENARRLCNLVRPRDFVILHDPQTAGLIPHLSAHGAIVLWRCHIGQDQRSDEADEAWSFLAPYLEPAHAFVFTRFAYVPDSLDHGRSVIVAPTIDPFSAKNQELDESTVRAILVHVGLVAGRDGGGPPTFRREDGSSYRVDRRVEVLQEGPPPSWETPLVVQVSRWDRLKDPVGVLQGFDRIGTGDRRAPELLLAGPDVRAIPDDPEGAEVFEQVMDAWRSLPVDRRRRIRIASLPMDDLDENAAIVNAIQRHAAVVVQKSLREGFGLTVTEAMWKGRPVVGSAVGGIQDQIEHGVSGMLLRDPSDSDAFASCVKLLLDDRNFARRLGVLARRRVGQQYLGLRSLTRYAELIERLDR